MGAVHRLDAALDTKARHALVWLCPIDTLSILREAEGRNDIPGEKVSELVCDRARETRLNEGLPGQAFRADPEAVSALRAVSAKHALEILRTLPAVKKATHVLQKLEERDSRCFGADDTAFNGSLAVAVPEQDVETAVRRSADASPITDILSKAQADYPRGALSTCGDDAFAVATVV